MHRKDIKLEAENGTGEQSDPENRQAVNTIGSKKTFSQLGEGRYTPLSFKSWLTQNQLQNHNRVGTDSLKKKIVLILLISTTCLIPMVNVGVLAFEKVLNVGLEDLVLLFAVLTFLPLDLKGSRLGTIILLYYFFAFFSTFLGLAIGWLEPIRAFLFLGKEVEYILLFMVIRKVAKDERFLRIAFTTFLICACVNICYMVFQLLTGQIGKMPEVTIPNRIQYYGIRTFAVYTPTVVGNYYSFVTIGALAVLIFASSWKQRVLSVICFGFGIVGIMASFARSATFGGGIALAVCITVLFLTKVKLKAKLMTALLSVILLVTVLVSFNYLKDKTDHMLRITRVGFAFAGGKYFDKYYQPKSVSEYINNALSRYLYERVEAENIFGPIIELFWVSPIFGFGKSVLGTTTEGIETHGEAHNYFLRVLIEMGVVGFFIFVYLVFRIFMISFRTFKDNRGSHQEKIIAFMNMGIVLFLVFSSFAQDSFVSVKTATLFWIFLGLMDGRIKWINMSLLSSHAEMKNRLSRNV